MLFQYLEFIEKVKVEIFCRSYRLVQKTPGSVDIHPRSYVIQTQLCRNGLVHSVEEPSDDSFDGGAQDEFRRCLRVTNQLSRS